MRASVSVHHRVQSRLQEASWQFTMADASPRSGSIDKAAEAAYAMAGAQSMDFTGIRSTDTRGTNETCPWHSSSNCSKDSDNSSELGQTAPVKLVGGDTRSRALIRLKRDLSFLKEVQTPRKKCLELIRKTFGTGEGNHQHWIRTPGANSLVGFVIIVNAAFIGVETDLAISETSPFWFIVETTFLVIFIGELVLRFRADRCRMLADYWNVFDCTIVLLGVVDTWILMAVMPSSSDRQSDLQTFTLFRLGRLVRIARILRVLRLLRFVRELLLLVKGLLGAMKALIWAFLLIMMVLYLSAVFATELIGHEENEVDTQLEMWFGSVGSSILTLSQLMTLEGWPNIVRYTSIDTGKIHLLFFFFAFLCCTNFALLNVVTAVMVEKVFEFAQDEKMQQAKTSNKTRALAIKKIQRLFTAVDKDCSGSVTTKELKDGVLNGEVTKQFQDLGIAKHDVDTLFQCLDVDGNGELSIAEFIEGCLRMHGVATAKDLLRIQYDVHRSRKSLDIKKLTRHMTWSALCLHKDFNRRIDSTKRVSTRKKTRAKTTGATEKEQSRNNTMQEAMVAKEEKRRRDEVAAAAKVQEGVVPPTISVTPGMEVPPAQVGTLAPAGTTLASTASGYPSTVTPRPPLSLGLPQGHKSAKVSPAAPPVEPVSCGRGGGQIESGAGNPPSTQTGASLQESPAEVSSRRHGSAPTISSGASASSSSPTAYKSRRGSVESLSLGVTGSVAGGPMVLNSKPSFKRSRTAPESFWKYMRRMDSDLASSVSNDTSVGSSAQASIAKPVAEPGLDAMELCLPAEGHRLLEEVMADQRYITQILMTLGEEIKELKRFSRPGAEINGFCTLKEEDEQERQREVSKVENKDNKESCPGPANSTSASSRSRLSWLRPRRSITGDPLVKFAADSTGSTGLARRLSEIVPAQVRASLHLDKSDKRRASNASKVAEQP